MLDLDASKLLIIGVFALIFLGPKELPRVMRQIGSAIGKMRRMAGDFQGQFMDAMREAELDDLKKEMNKLQDSAKVDLPSMDPLAGVSVDPARSADQAASDKPLDLGLPPAPETPPLASADFASTPAIPDTPVSASVPAEPAPVPVGQDLADSSASEPRRRSARPSGA